MLRRSINSLLSRPYFCQIRFSTSRSSNIFADDFDALLANDLKEEVLSPTTGVVAAVFGATGFVGKYVVQDLGETGSQIIIPYRGTENVFRHLRPLGDIGQIVPIACDVWRAEQVEDVLSQANVVINLIGKRWATKNFSMNDVNHKIPRMLARAAKDLGVKKFIHVSALEARENAVSEYGYTKYLGELAVREAFPEATILKPATLFGYEDRLLNKWAQIMKRWLFFPWVDSLLARKEGPLSVEDLSLAIQKCIFDPNTSGQTYELEGQVLTLSELLTLVKDITYLTPNKLPVPFDLLLFATQAIEYLHNPTITSDEWKSILADNITSSNARTLVDLQIEPSDIREAAYKVLRYYREPKFINEL